MGGGIGGVRGPVEGAATEEETVNRGRYQPTIILFTLFNYNNSNKSQKQVHSHRLVGFNATFLPEGAPLPFLRTVALRKSLHIFLNGYLSSSFTQTQR